MNTHRWSLLYSIGIFFVLVGLPYQVQAACPLPGTGSNVNIGANTCTVATVVGADSVSGSDNIASVTLDNVSSLITINNGGTLCLGSMIVSAGSTSVQAGGEIKTNCPLYVTDSDSDSYPPDLNLSLTSGAGLRRLSLMTSLSTLDCNDANAATYANLTCYPDADSDTYYSTTSHSVCAGASCAAAGESATVGTDCCDTDANAKPGQTSYFTTARTTCGGYDYNCNSSEEQQNTNGVSYSTCVSNGSACVFGVVGNGGWTGSVPSCGNSAQWQDAGCCPYSAGDCNSAGQYPNCSIGGQFTSNPTQACR